MRTVHWLFFVGVALFVSGIAFVVAGARTARHTPATRTAVEPVPVASVKQIMEGITGPAADTVFGAVSFTVSSTGTEEKAPRTAQEWQQVGNSAAALIESGNLLLMGSRAVDQSDWVKMSQMMMEGGKLALRATQAKDAEQVLAAGETINNACDGCHRKYQRGS